MNKQEIENVIHRLKGDIGLLEHYLKYRNPNLCEQDMETEFINDMSNAIKIMSQQLTNGWIQVSSGNLPKNEERVFILANRKRHDGKITKITTVAMHMDGTMHTDDSEFMWEDDDFEFDSETSDFIIPEGWWEQNMYCEVFAPVDDVVTHWMPMPPIPEEVSE